MAAVLPSGPPPNLAFMLGAACRQAGLDPSGSRLLRHFANAVYLVDGAVTRVHYSPEASTRWLVQLGFPATAPLGLPSAAEQPITIHHDGHDVAVTFWHYYPQPTPSPAKDFAALGRMAQQLHAISSRPPVTLPPYQPLRGLQVLLSTTPHGVDQNIHQWLTDRVACLLEEAATLQYPLGNGLIHADMYSET